MRDRLSGALETPVKVKEWVEGGYRALIPVSALVPTGLRVAESVIPGYAATLTGNEASASAAERYVAKRVSEGYVARLVGFDAPTRRAIFEIQHGPETAPT